MISRLLAPHRSICVWPHVCGFLTITMVTIGAIGSSRGAEPPVFERDVRPILKTYCLDCHGAEEKLKGGLDLRLRRFALKGGDSGPALVPGDLAGSLLVERVKSGDMPPAEKKVPPEKLAVCEAWVAAGAPVGREEPETLPPGLPITPEDRAYWFFQPLKRPEAPQVPGTVASPAEQAAQPQADLVRTPIDQFVVAKLRDKGLKLAPEADRLTLLRRVAFDLTGLPPTQAELDEYLADASADAYEKMVDRYLKSPAYGERWGRHWLDIAGYADSEGNGNEDTPRAFAYKYRDYVIRAFNADKPFDQFVTEQLAGDELVPQPWNNLAPEQIEKLVATGFLRMGVDQTATGGDSEEATNLVVGDMLKIVSTSLLGLSVGCAQCHDHKYDPISQADYFRLRAIFEPALDPAHWRRPGQRLVSLYTDADRAKAATVDAEAQVLQTAYNEKQQKLVMEAFEKNLEKFPEDLRGPLREAYTTPADKRNDAQKKLLDSNPNANINPGVLYQYNQAAADDLKKDMEKINAKRAEKPVEDFVSVTNEVPGTIPETKLFYRGDYRDKRQVITPGDLTIAAAEGQRLEIPTKNPELPTTGRRLAWAKHLTKGDHPLLGRVLVNRIWMHHFGRGIVETPAEFGQLGTRPTHPELLDWLAVEFANRGWSLKALHRLIMTSQVYRQSAVAAATPAGGVEPAQVDTLNSLYWKFPLRRLEAEALRDRMLAASGRLDQTPFGHSIPVEENFAGQVQTKDNVARRSLYLQVRRTKPVSFLTTFDAPVMTVNCERRMSSTGALQSLMLMNNDAVLKEAEHFAQRIRKETPAEFARDLTAACASRYPRHTDAWQYGYGAVDAATGKLASFSPLPHFNGSAWQGGATLPDAALGWVLVHGQGGHPGDAQHASIRRWVAPTTGTVTLAGKLGHGSQNGDGVRARVVSSRTGIAGEWTAKGGEVETPVAQLAVEAGDTLDFVVECRETVESDSYNWGISVKLTSANGQPVGTWDSASDFHGPATVSIAQQIAFAWQVAYQRPISAEELELACEFVARQLDHLRTVGEKTDHELSAMTSLCQQLLSSNEFLHVD
ncbi:MAG: PSD1 and planctomycete cytochrome C domain-containing protein [Planctomycetaceae bacterium]